VPDPYQWEIWEATWVHEDGTAKPRPVLVLTGTSHNFAAGKIWVAKFTKTRRDAPHRYEFNSTDPAFPKTGLTATCYLYLQEAREIDKSLLLYKRGQLSSLAALMIGFTIKGLFKPPLP